MERLPEAEVLTAGFPCQPFSQAGPAQGLSAGRPLISAMIDLLRRSQVRPLYLVLENVPNIVHLAGGEALRFITCEVERLGYSWAYRIIDSSAFGLPQRRARWVFVASLLGDAASILLMEDVPKRPCVRFPLAHGFYWTEGNRGLGWADDAVPPLKSGSGLGIPSPPALWDVRCRAIVKPSIRDAERLQGFPAEWTKWRGGPKIPNSYERLRWKMVGNAVSVPAAKWIAERIASRLPVCEPIGTPFPKHGPWPRAAYGQKNRRKAVAVSAWPTAKMHPPILDFLHHETEPLSARATRGFRSRLEKSRLRYPPEFLRDLKRHERTVGL